MRANIKKRLDKLDSQMPREMYEFTRARLFVIDCIAYYFGSPTSNEPFFSAFARALGYTCERDLETAMRCNDPNYAEKYSLAVRKLFAKFNVSSDEEFVAEAKRMYAGISKAYKKQMGVPWEVIEKSLSGKFGHSSRVGPRHATHQGEAT